MSENSKIEWTDHTFNPWEGCQKVGPGCDHCYAETRNARFGGGVAINWGPGAQRRRTSPANWRKPLQWNANAEAFQTEHGRRQRVFCASLADVFDNEVDIIWLADLLQLIWLTPNLDWLLLTKRIGNALPRIQEAAKRKEAYGMAAAWLHGTPPENVWLGATVVNQEEADRDIPKLLAVPARVRFLSMEPLLGPVNLHLKLTTVEERLRVQRELARTPNQFQRLNTRGELLHWIIAGGESGPGARPSHPDWYRSLRDQCAAAGVPFLFKQWGEWVPVDLGSSREECHVEDGSDRDLEGRITVARLETQDMARAGKKAAGRLLDGIEHNGFPS